MKNKVAIVTAVFWLIMLVSGAVFEKKAQEGLPIPRRSAGIQEVRTLRRLYNQRLFQDVLNECNRAEHDQRYAASLPQILYIQWITERRLGNFEQSDRVKDVFLKRYPKKLLAADMHLSDAEDLLAKGEYISAEKELAMIDRDYPSASIIGDVHNLEAALKQ